MTQETKQDNERVAENQALTEGAEPPAPIVVSPPSRVLPTMQELGLMSQIARTLVNARGHAVPKDIDSPSKAAAVLLAGWELGLRPMTAFRHVYVVNGRTEVDAQVMMGLVKAKEPEADFVFHTYTREACKVELRRPGRTPVTVEYTIEDAEASGQLGKAGPWQQYRRDMLAWAAVKRVCRLGAPDLINAVPSIDVGDMPDVIEGVAAEAEALPEPEPEEVQQALLSEEAVAPDPDPDGAPEPEPAPEPRTRPVRVKPEPEPAGPPPDDYADRTYALVAEAWPKRDAGTVLCQALNLPEIGEDALREHWFGHGGSWKQAAAAVAEVRRVEVTRQVLMIEAAEKYNAYGRLLEIEKKKAEGKA